MVEGVCSLRDDFVNYKKIIGNKDKNLMQFNKKRVYRVGVNSFFSVNYWKGRKKREQV